MCTHHVFWKCCPRSVSREEGNWEKIFLLSGLLFWVGGMGVWSEAKKHTNKLLEFVTKKEPAAQKKLSEYVKIWQSRMNLIFLIAVCVLPDRICLICEDFCLHLAFCLLFSFCFLHKVFFVFAQVFWIRGQNTRTCVSLPFPLSLMSSEWEPEIHERVSLSLSLSR